MHQVNADCVLFACLQRRFQLPQLAGEFDALPRSATLGGAFRPGCKPLFTVLVWA